MDALLAVDDLTVAYTAREGGRHCALRGVSFAIGPGEAVGVLGESGSGKTTLAQTVLGLLPPAGAVVRGEVRWRGANLLALGERALQRIRGAEIALVAQEPALALNPVLRVGTQVAEVLRAHRRLGAAAARREARALLAEFGLDAAMAAAYPHQLSGGERQRVAIAQALAAQPALLVADEPTTALDAVTQMETLALLRGLRQRFGLALLLISHDPAVLAGMAEQALVLYGGRVIEAGAMAQVLRAPLHPYTRGLLASGRPVAAAADGARRLACIPGEGSLAAAGCAFAPRCGDRMEICLRQEPVESRPEPARRVACYLHGR